MPCLLARHADQAASIVESLSTAEKVGRVFVFTLSSEVAAENLLKLSPSGFIRLYTDALTAARQHQRLRELASYPLLIAADFEKGVAPVVCGATEFGPSMALAATDNPELTKAVAKAIALEARAVGVNWNLMPTVDVNTDPRNPIINVRSFSDSPQTVEQHSIAFWQGCHQGGVLACAKHFPGHGSTSVDSHLELPIIGLPREQLVNEHFGPFATLIHHGLEAIMIGHLSCPTLDPSGLPATLSPTIANGVLRGELGFKGVVVSDALDMGALTSRYSQEEIVVRAFLAGCDLLLMPADPLLAYHALLSAVERGDVPRSRLDEAVHRIVALSLFSEDLRANLCHETLTTNVDNLANTEHKKLSYEVARRSITVLRGRQSSASLQRKRVAVISFSTTREGVFDYFYPKVFGDYCQRFGESTSSLYCGYLADERYDMPNIADEAVARCLEADVVVLGIYARVAVASGRIGFSEREHALMQRIFSVGKSIIVVLFGSPYLVQFIPENVQLVYCTYGTSHAMQRVAAELLYGQAQAAGSLPVKLPGKDALR